VTCHLCIPACPIVTISSRAWMAAMDHGLDWHVPAMIADPESATRAFTINTTGRAVPLRPDRERAS
jgi:hypothetical protein